MNLQITHLFDNVVYKPELSPLWGYSVFIEYGSHRLLFDTGSNGRELLRHMQMMGVDPASIDYLFISHRHWDHIGGLDSVLELNPSIRLVVPSTLSDHLLDDLLRQKYQLTVVKSEPVTILPGLYSTGTLEGPEAEQVLVISTDAGLNVITGCAHPGLPHILKTVTQQHNAPIRMVMGGFHLLKSSDKHIRQTVEQLREFGVQHIAPSHCTGDRAKNMFRKLLPDPFMDAGAGRVYSF